MLGWIKKVWNCIGVGLPSDYDVWRKAFDRLEAEKKLNGRSKEYWRIWYEEVCPAYRKLSENTPKSLRHPDTEHILEDMDKLIGSREHF